MSNEKRTETLLEIRDYYAWLGCAKSTAALDAAISALAAQGGGEPVAWQYRYAGTLPNGGNSSWQWCSREEYERYKATSYQCGYDVRALCVASPPVPVERGEELAWQNIEMAESEFLTNLADKGGLAPLVSGMLRHCARLLANQPVISRDLRSKPQPAAHVSDLIAKYEVREGNYYRLLDGENAWARGSHQQIQDFLADLRALTEGSGRVTDALPFTDATIDKLQDVMAFHGFAVPVRVISDAFRTAMYCAALNHAEKGEG